MTARGSLVVVLALLAAGGALAQDAGAPDAGDPDAGAQDAGAPDAGLADAGLDEDAGLDGDAGLDEDAGPDGDAGPDDVVAPDGGGCDFEAFCDGDVLHFCDGVAEVLLDCTELAAGARCGLLSEEWGFDCLLPAGAACAPGYAEGRSRCDPAAGLFCSEGTCGTTPPDDDGELQPSPGSGALVAQEDASQASCLGCPGSQGAAVLFAFSLALLGRRRRSR